MGSGPSFLRARTSLPNLPIIQGQVHWRLLASHPAGPAHHKCCVTGAAGAQLCLSSCWSLGVSMDRSPCQPGSRAPRTPLAGSHLQAQFPLPSADSFWPAPASSILGTAGLGGDRQLTHVISVFKQTYLRRRDHQQPHSTAGKTEAQGSEVTFDRGGPGPMASHSNSILHERFALGVHLRVTPSASDPTELRTTALTLPWLLGTYPVGQIPS